MAPWVAEGEAPVPHWWVLAVVPRGRVWVRQVLPSLGRQTEVGAVPLGSGQLLPPPWAWPLRPLLPPALHPALPPALPRRQCRPQEPWEPSALPQLVQQVQGALLVPVHSLQPGH